MYVCISKWSEIGTETKPTHKNTKAQSKARMITYSLTQRFTIPIHYTHACGKPESNCRCRHNRRMQTSNNECKSPQLLSPPIFMYGIKIKIYNMRCSCDLESGELYYVWFWTQIIWTLFFKCWNRLKPIDIMKSRNNLVFLWLPRTHTVIRRHKLYIGIFNIIIVSTLNVSTAHSYE